MPRIPESLGLDMLGSNATGHLKTHFSQRVVEWPNNRLTRVLKALIELFAFLNARHFSIRIFVVLFVMHDSCFSAVKKVIHRGTSDVSAALSTFFQQRDHH